MASLLKADRIIVCDMLWLKLRVELVDPDDVFKSTDDSFEHGSGS